MNFDRHINKYNPVTPELVAKLSSIVGEKNIIFNDEEKLEPFSHDEIPGKKYRHMPDVVVFPSGSDEISKIMKIANENLIPVTPRGAGSGLSGGAVPLYGGIVIASDKMNRILELDMENLTITVEPGVITKEINEYLEEYGLFYAGYPMSMETCYIGGNVAENAGGGKAVKYGVTSRYVLGLEVVTPMGEIIELGGKLLKDVTGYNLIQLFIGSEGTLGIFTKIILKLLPLPKEQVDLLCLFESAEEAIAVVPKIMTECGIIPTSIEFMDKVSIKGACDYFNEKLPFEQTEAMLLITVDGADKESVEKDYFAIGDYCERAGALQVYVADNPTTSEQIWKLRRNIAEAYSVISSRQSGEDIVVPPASIPKIVAKFSEISKKYSVLIPCFGHAGDGNIHAHIVSDPSWTDEYWDSLLPKILSELYEFTKELGGTISGEHGIGCKRKKYISKVLSAEHINLLKAIKSTFDPNNILNPGKIF